ncbi:FAD/NAD(P)-binding domain-containing protein [Annulohypoxylon maeteangense]|uniref:FAD/NAD(P)-binding domain-containing protein n=1 Tax=Annulohypoxylon maeteangense TaxID=1927788 RepID=UPI0020076926|nr:FAD/NAD(P)-binding domain-containing protein [Annulohypoxylon maeteangense]KAI0888701.1 FAD/NAD(P)-binding domain-containing protein [Annulohypoxylon maeteangense]
MTQMKVLISGGGIAGNALAFWLGKLGHDVTIVEWFPTLRTTGLQIDLRGHGVEVLKRMGLEQAFRSKSVPEQGSEIVNSAGVRQALFPANRSGKGLQNFTTDWEIMRGDLCQLLYEECKDHTKYIFGTSIQSFEEKGNSIEIRFTNGKTDRFDLLVGADGIGSKTRKMMVGPDADDGFRPLRNIYIAYFTIPRPISAGEEYLATMYIAPGGRAVMLRRHSPDQMQVYLMCKNDSKRLKNSRRGDTREERAALTDIFRGAGWVTEQVLVDMDRSDDFYLEHMGLVKLDAWSSGSVTLLGDAAYCPSANTGMGTSSAIVGAYVLAGEIGRHCKEGVDVKEGLAVALKAYEQTFRPFVDQVQKGLSEDSGAWANLMPTTAFGIRVMCFVVWVMALFRMNVIGRWLLREDVKWNLPEYKEILRK